MGKRKPEFYISITAIAIAALAFGMSVLRWLTQKQHHRLLFHPVAELKWGGGEMDPPGSPYNFTLKLINHGQGLALLTNGRINYRDQVFGDVKHLRDVLNSEIKALSLSGSCQIESHYKSFTNNPLLEAGEKREVLSFKIVCDESVRFDEIRGVLSRVNIDLSYESMYGKKHDLTMMRTLEHPAFR